MLANQAFHLQVTQMVSRNDSAGNLAELTSFESGVMTSRLWDLTCERGHKQVSIGLHIPWNTRLGPFWGGGEERVCIAGPRSGWLAMLPLPTAGRVMQGWALGL
jgi:hypothetical protein